MSERRIRLRYRPRKREHDRELRPWYIDTGALWGVRRWGNHPMWVGPFRTAAGAVRLDLDEMAGGA